MSGALLNDLSSDPARASQGGLEYSDLSPLVKRNVQRHSVVDEPRGFRTAALREKKPIRRPGAGFYTFSGAKHAQI